MNSFNEGITTTATTQKMKFSIKDFFSWSHLVKKSLMENFILGVVRGVIYIVIFPQKKVFKDIALNVMVVFPIFWK